MQCLGRQPPSGLPTAYYGLHVLFTRCAQMTGTESKRMMRMLGPKGNPTARNLLLIIGHLQRTSGILQLHTHG